MQSFFVCTWWLLLIVSIEHIKSVVSVADDDKCTDGTSPGMWGDVDPNIFHICDRATGTALTIHCPEGRGYFSGLGYHGCIPYDQWPACVTVKNRSYVCDSEHMMHPWQTGNPNTFFMCPRGASAPIEVNCEAGKGFVYVSSGSDSGGDENKEDAPLVSGCATWEKWRMYMQCESYY